MAIETTEAAAQQANQAGARMTPPLRPLEPVRPAPAKFGTAGISAGEDAFFKRSLPARARWSRESTPNTIARGLGWFSIGLGVGEILGARDIARMLGVKKRAGVVSAFGVREIANGTAILMSNRPRNRTRFLWMRVAGDALDLAALGAALTPRNRRKANVIAAMAAVAGVTAVDILCASLLRER